MKKALVKNGPPTLLIPLLVDAVIRITNTRPLICSPNATAESEQGKERGNLDPESESGPDIKGLKICSPVKDQ